MGLVQQGGQSGRSPNALAYEQLRNLCSFLVEADDREFIVESGVFLHMLMENDLTSGRSTEPTVITTASGKAEPTEEATVYVNDLEVFAR